MLHLFLKLSMGMLEVSIKFCDIRDGLSRFRPSEPKNQGFESLHVLKSSFVHDSQIGGLICVSFVLENFYGYFRGVRQISCHSGGRFTISSVKTKTLKIRKATFFKIYLCAQHSNWESDLCSICSYNSYRYAVEVYQVSCHLGGRFTTLPVKTKKLSIRPATCFKI